MLTRRLADADDALAWGLVTQLSRPDEVEATIAALVDDLLGGSPTAQHVTKQLVDAALQKAPASIVEALASGLTAATEDYQAGVHAFRTKTRPTFRGR